MYSRALRADLGNQLPHQIRIGLDVVPPAVGPLLLTLIRIGGKHPLGDLPRAELFFGPILQIADDGHVIVKAENGYTQVVYAKSKDCL